MIKASILFEKTEQALAIDHFTRDTSFRDILKNKIKFRKQLSEKKIKIQIHQIYLYFLKQIKLLG